MNADILKRIVRAIADGSQGDLDRLARKVVESERQVGHAKLADQLAAILARPRPTRNGQHAANENERGLVDSPCGGRRARRSHPAPGCGCRRPPSGLSRVDHACIARGHGRCLTRVTSVATDEDLQGSS